MRGLSRWWDRSYWKFEDKAIKITLISVKVEDGRREDKKVEQIGAQKLTLACNKIRIWAGTPQIATAWCRKKLRDRQDMPDTIESRWYSWGYADEGRLVGRGIEEIRIAVWRWWEKSPGHYAKIIGRLGTVKIGILSRDKVAKGNPLQDRLWDWTAVARNKRATGKAAENSCLILVDL